MSRMQDKYQKEVIKQLQTEFDYKNFHQVPKVAKIVVNVGTGKGLQDKRYQEVAINTVRKITTQQPVVTNAKHSIAGFKLREGNPVGLKVTLRGQRMYEFLDRLISVVLPRMRDFRGVSPRSFDKEGNYNLGLKDQTVFAELSYDDTVIAHGVQITITTTATNPEQGRRLLQLLGMPFSKESK